MAKMATWAIRVAEFSVSVHRSLAIQIAAVTPELMDKAVLAGKSP